MARVSVAVMAHPKRRRFVEELVEQIDVDAPVVWDRRGDRWDTGRRSMLAYDPSATHHLVIQDDAVPCRDVAAAAARAAHAAGERPVSLYTGRIRPYSKRVYMDFADAVRAGATWLEMGGPWWGVGIMLPTVHIPEMIAWADKRTDVANYDKRIGRWYVSQKIKCWYTVPSLVDHRGVAENPSLVKGRTGDRHAQRFIGADASGLQVQWGAVHRPDAGRGGAVTREEREAQRAAMREWRIDVQQERRRVAAERRAGNERRRKESQAAQRKTTSSSVSDGRPAGRRRPDRAQRQGWRVRAEQLQAEG